MKNLICWGTLFIGCMYSCQSKKSDEKITAAEAKAISLQDTLSEADVQKMMNATDVAELSYNGAMTNDASKEYFFQSDSNQQVQFVLKTNHPELKMYVFKEGMKKVRKDSANFVKMKDYVLIKDSSIVNDFSKKPTKYKALVKFAKHIYSPDSTAMYSIEILTP